MAFDILNATGPQAERWSALVGRLEDRQRDIHFLPEYGRIYAQAYGFQPLLAFFGDDDAYVIQAFVKRPLNGLPFLREQNVADPFFDIASPYGYGGPAWRAPDFDGAVSLYRGLRRALSAWCHEQRIASEFVSLHPLLGNEGVVRAVGVEALPVKQVVYIDCAGGEAALWTAMSRGHKSNLRRAQKAGIAVEKVALSAGNLAEFRRLYYLTMDRSRATERWYFPERYFSDCAEQLGENRLSLFFARAAGELASAYLLMHDFSIAYYHFAGADPKFFDLRPNNAIMHATAQWAVRAGCRAYHLGGGVAATEDDALFRFKAGFSPLRANLFSYGVAHHQGAYRELSELKLRHEAAAGGEAASSDYFPAYRR